MKTHREDRRAWLHSQILLDRTVTRATNMKKQTVTRQTPGGDLTSLQTHSQCQISPEYFWIKIVWQSWSRCLRNRKFGPGTILSGWRSNLKTVWNVPPMFFTSLRPYSLSAGKTNSGKIARERHNTLSRKYKNSSVTINSFSSLTTLTKIRWNETFWSNDHSQKLIKYQSVHKYRIRQFISIWRVDSTETDVHPQELYQDSF